MRIQLSIIITVLSLFCLNQNAYSSYGPLADEEIATVSDSSCAEIDSDPYAHPRKFTANSINYAGECLDIQRNRPAVVIETDKSSNEMRVANIYHDNKYWTGHFSTENIVDEVFLQVIRFPVVKGIEAAHVQIRFKLKDGKTIKIQSQLRDDEDNLSDLIISWEAARPTGVAYNFALGAFDNYALVGRVNSLTQRLGENSGKKIEQHRIDLSDTEKQMMLEMALRRSELLGSDTFYNTLRPNCTTEVFDLLDLAPSIRNKFDPFLTVISGDPIATPSIEGLKERGIYGGRYANLEDEVNNGATEAPAQDSPSEGSDFLLNLDGIPYSLVLFSPDDGVLNSEHDELVKEVQKIAFESLPQVVQAVGSSMLLQQDASTVLISVLKAMTKNWQQKLQALNSKMPDVPTNIMLYLVPWDQKRGERVRLKDLGIQARLPFTSRKVEYVSSSQEDFYFVTNGIRKVHDELYGKGDAAYMLGAALSFRIEKDNSQISAQAMLGLDPVVQAQEVVNEQVEISELVIPQTTARSEKPIALVNVIQSIDEDLPRLNIEFGAEGGLSPSSRSLGSFQIFNGADAFTRRSRSVPTLKGVFGDRAVPLKPVAILLKGKAVEFSIFDVDIDIESTSVTDMDIRVSTGPIKGISQESINSQFAENVNQMLKSKIDAAKGEKNLIGKFMDDIIGNNTDETADLESCEISLDKKSS